MSDASSDPDQLAKTATDYGELINEIDDKTMRWLELSEKTID